MIKFDIRKIRTRWDTLVVICLLLVFSGWRTITLQNRSLDSDEIFSILFSQRFHYNLLNTHNPFDDGNPPLHFVIVKFFNQVLGLHAELVRLSSVIFYFLSGYYVYLLSKHFLGNQAIKNIFAVLFFLSSSLIFFYAGNNRPYSLLVLTSLATFYYQATYFFTPHRAYTVLLLSIIACTVGFYTHYSFTIFFAFLWLSLLVFIRSKQKLLKTVQIVLPPLLLYSPWIIRFGLSQLYPKTHGAGAPYYLWQKSLPALSFTRWMSVVFNFSEGNYVHSLIIAILLILLLSIVTFKIVKREKYSQQKLFFHLFLCVSLILFFMTPLYKTLTIPRYSIFLIPFIYLSLSTFVRFSKSFVLSVPLVCIVFIFFIRGTTRLDTPHEDWRGLAQYLSAHSLVAGKTVIIADQYYLVPVIRFYYTGSAVIGCLKEFDESSECKISKDEISTYLHINYVQAPWTYPYTGMLENDNIVQKDSRHFASIVLFELTNKSVK